MALEDQYDISSTSLPISHRVLITSNIPEPLQFEPQVFDEPNRWSVHSLSSSFFAHNVRPIGAPSLDVGDGLFHTKIGSTVLHFQSIGEGLQSSEQRILREIKAVIGDQPVLQSKLQFAPRWIIKKTIYAKKQSYIDAEAYNLFLFGISIVGRILSPHTTFLYKSIMVKLRSEGFDAD